VIGLSGNELQDLLRLMASMIGLSRDELQDYLWLMMSALGCPRTIDKTRFIKGIRVGMT
jgi:hypothetical protein